MIVEPLTNYQPRHRPAKRPAVTAPTTLTLVAASWDPGASLTLAFNQAIDIAAFNGEGILVNDPVETGSVWMASGGAELVSPTTLRVVLNEFEAATGATVTLTAPDYTGLVATHGGATWGGVNDVALPFG